MHKTNFGPTTNSDMVRPDSIQSDEIRSEESQVFENVCLKKPKKKFEQYSDYMDHKNGYIKKYKTEMCKNW